MPEEGSPAQGPAQPRSLNFDSTTSNQTPASDQADDFSNVEPVEAPASLWDFLQNRLYLKLHATGPGTTHVNVHQDESLVGAYFLILTRSGVFEQLESKHHQVLLYLGCLIRAENFTELKNPWVIAVQKHVGRAMGMGVNPLGEAFTDLQSIHLIRPVIIEDGSGRSKKAWELLPPNPSMQIGERAILVAGTPRKRLYIVTGQIARRATSALGATSARGAQVARRALDGEEGVEVGIEDIARRATSAPGATSALGALVARSAPEILESSARRATSAPSARENLGSGGTGFVPSSSTSSSTSKAEEEEPSKEKSLDELLKRAGIGQPVRGQLAALATTTPELIRAAEIENRGRGAGLLVSFIRDPDCISDGSWARARGVIVPTPATTATPVSKEDALRQRIEAAGRRL